MSVYTGSYFFEFIGAFGSMDAIETPFQGSKKQERSIQANSCSWRKYYGAEILEYLYA